MRKIGWLLAIASTSLLSTAAHAQERASYTPAALTGAEIKPVLLAEAAPARPTLLPARGGGNNPPDAVDDYIYLQCNSGGGFYMFTNDSDPDGDQLTITSFTSSGTIGIWMGHPTLGILSIAGGYVPGLYTGTYTISDGHGGTDTAVIYVDVSHGGPNNC